MNNCRLDFVGIGPERTATTWMHHYLKRYENVRLPKKVKEVCFFNRRYSKGLDWYFSHFQTLNGDKITGEVCSSYIYSVLASQMVHKLNPKCKIICFLRDPVERSFSFYLCLKRYGRIRPGISFLEAIEELPRLIEGSKYYTHLSRWLELFGGENTCILMFDDLKGNPANITKALCNFLGLKEKTFPEELQKPVNVTESARSIRLARIGCRILDLLGDYKPYFAMNVGRKLKLNKIMFGGREVQETLNKEDEEYFYNLVRGEIESLEGLLNLDLSSWKKC